MNLIRALKLEDELKMIQSIDLSGYNMKYIKGLCVHLPSLKDVNL